jgi:hypothetical protein
MAESTYKVISYPAAKLPPAYQSLIFAKWLRSLRYGNEIIKMIEPNAYFMAYHRYIEHLMQLPGATVRLAVLSDDRDVVLGFCMYRGSILYYIHVHKYMRGNGIAQSLTPKQISQFNHMTKAGEYLWQKRHKNWIFNPFAE